MVSNATVSQAIEGVDFPTTGPDLVRLIEHKVEEGILPESFVEPVLDLFRAMPKNARLMNMSHLWEEVGRVQGALRQQGGPERIHAEDVIVPERKDAPMALGELEPDYELADRVREEHDGHTARERENREGGR